MYLASDRDNELYSEKIWKQNAVQSVNGMMFAYNNSLNQFPVDGFFADRINNQMRDSNIYVEGSYSHANEYQTSYDNSRSAGFFIRPGAVSRNKCAGCTCGSFLFANLPTLH